LKKKQYIINLDWKIKLKTNKNYTKELRKKIKNQKKEDRGGKKIHGKLRLNDEIKKNYKKTNEKN
jgi:thymidylate synthase